MTRKIILLLSILFSTTTLFAQNNSVWSIQQCVDYALENNISIKQLKNNAESSKYRLIASKAELAPTLNGNVSHNSSWGLQFDPSTLVLQNSYYQTANITASSRFIIFNGLANYYTISQNKFTHEADLLDFEQAKDDVTLNIIQLYFQVLFAQERLKVLEEQIKTLEIQEERNRILNEAGSITKSDYLSIKSQLATQQVTFINGQNALVEAMLQLTQALNLEITQIQIAPIDFEKLIVEEINNDVQPENIIQFAFNNRPLIKAFEKRIESAKRGLFASRGYYVPSIAMNASVGTLFTGNRKENPLDPNSPIMAFGEQLRQNNSQQLSFGMSVPIFNGLQTRTQVQLAKITLFNSELNLQNEKLKLRNTIQKVYTDAKSAYNVYIANKTSLESLEEAYNYAVEKYQVKAINAFEFNDAATRYFNAKTELLIATFDYVFKKKVLDFYNGKTIRF